MEPQTKTSAKDFFINLGAIVALYSIVISLLNLLFNVINYAYPQITITGDNYYGSQSISMPVATLIIFFPVFVLLMWLMEKNYKVEPEKKHLGVRRWLIYITLFVAGLILAGDLVTVLYYFIDGQEMTNTGFIFKILSVFVVILTVLLYYVFDIRNKLTPAYRKIWFGVSFVIILGSIIWGFSVLGSPWTRRQINYDMEKITALENISSSVQGYYNDEGKLPQTVSDIMSFSDASDYLNFTDYQTGKQYEYIKTGDTTFSVCADFNKKSTQENLTQLYVPGTVNLTTYPAGHYCFKEVVSETGDAYPQVYLAPEIVP
jgi:Domain of unknown function (DUF5671)